MCFCNLVYEAVAVESGLEELIKSSSSIVSRVCSICTDGMMGGEKNYIVIGKKIIQSKFFMSSKKLYTSKMNYLK